MIFWPKDLKVFVIIQWLTLWCPWSPVKWNVSPVGAHHQLRGMCSELKAGPGTQQTQRDGAHWAFAATVEVCFCHFEGFLVVETKTKICCKKDIPKKSVEDQGEAVEEVDQGDTPGEWGCWVATMLSPSLKYSPLWWVMYLYLHWMCKIHQERHQYCHLYLSYLSYLYLCCYPALAGGGGRFCICIYLTSCICVFVFVLLPRCGRWWV